jgi:hypothetical protein
MSSEAIIRRPVAEERDPQIKRWLEIGDEALGLTEASEDREAAEEFTIPVESRRGKILPFRRPR